MSIPFTSYEKIVLIPQRYVPGENRSSYSFRNAHFAILTDPKLVETIKLWTISISWSVGTDQELAEKLLERFPEIEILHSIQLEVDAPGKYENKVK